MIKRRFYKMEHGDQDNASDQSSSSSSDSEIEPEPESVSSDDDQPCSGEDETLSHISDADSDDDANEIDDQLLCQTGASKFQDQSSDSVADTDWLPEYVVKRKSIFKCRICPTVVCLNEEALRDHIKSKRHARSEKLLNEGMLKTVLNSDGKLDEEMPALYARILAHPQALPRKRSKQEDKSRPRKKRMKKENKKSKGSSGKKRRK